MANVIVAHTPAQGVTQGVYSRGQKSCNHVRMPPAQLCLWDPSLPPLMSDTQYLTGASCKLSGTSRPIPDPPALRSTKGKMSHSWIRACGPGRRHWDGASQGAEKRLRGDGFLKDVGLVRADRMGVRLRDKGGNSQPLTSSNGPNPWGTAEGRESHTYVVLHCGFKPGTRRVKQTVTTVTLVLPPSLAILLPVTQLRQVQPKLRECNVPSIVFMVEQ